jgi:hypothetical protein
VTYTRIRQAAPFDIFFSADVGFANELRRQRSRCDGPRAVCSRPHRSVEIGTRCQQNESKGSRRSTDSRGLRRTKSTSATSREIVWVARAAARSATFLFSIYDLATICVSKIYARIPNLVTAAGVTLPSQFFRP